MLVAREYCERKCVREEGKAREENEGEERDRGTEGEISYSNQATEVLISDGEQCEKEERKTGGGLPTQLPWALR